jgi:hypothetical protein
VQFEEEVKEILFQTIDEGYEKTIPISVIKRIAVGKKKSLVYPHYWKAWFARFVDVCDFYKYGRYDENSQLFILNELNDEIFKKIAEKAKNNAQA